MSNNLDFNGRMELSRYVTSHGAEVPPDYSRFLPGAEFENLCVFCGAQDDGYYVYKYDVIRETRKKLDNICCCSVCQKEIDKMLIIYFPEYYEIDMMSKSPKEYYKGFEASDEDRQRRIDIFIRDRSFSVDVDNYYLHLDFLYDEYTQNKFCYFCRTTHWDKYYYIEVPVSQSSTLNGGKIPCCRGCAGDNTEMSLKPPKEVNNVCPKCILKYSITTEEYEYRKLKGTISKHLCPECVYKELNKINTDKSILYMKENTSPRKFPMERFKVIECSVCGESEVIDLTIDHKKLIIKHSLDRVTYKFRCSACYILGTSRANGNKFHVKVRDNYYLIFTKLGKFWSYSLVLIVQETIKIIMESPKDIYTNEDSEIGFIAYEEAIKVLSSKQKELWEEQ